MAYVSGIRGTETGISGRIAGMVNNLRDTWRRNRVYRETVRELSALSARDLADIGIQRSQIHAISAKAAFGA